MYVVPGFSDGEDGLYLFVEEREKGGGGGYGPFQADLVD